MNLFFEYKQSRACEADNERASDEGYQRYQEPDAAGPKQTQGRKSRTAIAFAAVVVILVAFFGLSGPSKAPVKQPNGLLGSTTQLAGQPENEHKAILRTINEGHKHVNLLMDPTVRALGEHENVQRGLKDSINKMVDMVTSLQDDFEPDEAAIEGIFEEADAKTQTAVQRADKDNAELVRPQQILASFNNINQALYKLQMYDTQPTEDAIMSIKMDYFDFRDMLMASNLLAANTYDRMAMAIQDANDLVSEEILFDKDPEVRRECWIILFEHTIKQLETSLEGSVKISEQLAKFVRDLRVHTDNFKKQGTLLLENIKEAIRQDEVALKALKKEYEASDDCKWYDAFSLGISCAVRTKDNKLAQQLGELAYQIEASTQLQDEFSQFKQEEKKAQDVLKLGMDQETDMNIFKDKIKLGLEQSQEWSQKVGNIMRPKIGKKFVKLLVGKWQFTKDAAQTLQTNTVKKQKEFEKVLASNNIQPTPSGAKDATNLVSGKEATSLQEDLEDTMFSYLEEFGQTQVMCNELQLRFSRNIMDDTQQMGKIMEAWATFPDSFPSLADATIAKGYEGVRDNFQTMIETAQDLSLSWLKSINYNKQTYQTMTDLVSPEMIADLFTDAPLALTTCHEAFQKFYAADKPFREGWQKSKEAYMMISEKQAQHRKEADDRWQKIQEAHAKVMEQVNKLREQYEKQWTRREFKIPLYYQKQINTYNLKKDARDRAVAIFEQIAFADNTIIEAFDYTPDFFRSPDGALAPKVTAYKSKYESITKKLQKASESDKFRNIQLDVYTDLFIGEIENQVLASDTALSNHGRLQKRFDTVKKLYTEM